jgi:hypothetical protein
MHSEVDEFPVLDINETGYLLIPSRFPPVPIYGRIANGNDEQFAKIESLTNPRLKERDKLIALSGHQLDETSPKLQNWNHAPFAYPNPEGTWLFDKTTRFLELSTDKQTALAVSVKKREIFLGRTSQKPIGLDMRMLGRPVIGRFLDARTLSSNLSQTERRNIGATILQRLRTMEKNDDKIVHGVLFHSSERPTGTRLVVLQRDAVPNRTTQMEHYRFSWNGQRITSLYAFDSNRTDDENKLDPDDLKGEELISQVA